MEPFMSASPSCYHQEVNLSLQNDLPSQNVGEAKSGCQLPAQAWLDMAWPGLAWLGQAMPGLARSYPLVDPSSYESCCSDFVHITRDGCSKGRRQIPDV